MHGMKLISWIAGLSVIGGAIITAPASAEPANHAGTATNVFSNTAIRYGFEPLSNNPVLSPAVQEIQDLITSLTDGNEISPDTKASLLALLERFNETEQRSWAYEGEIDQNIRDSASGLLRDLAEADARCRANASTCGNLNSLVEKITAFVSNLENLRTSLIRNGQEARIY